MNLVNEETMKQIKGGVTYRTENRCYGWQSVWVNNKWEQRSFHDLYISGKTCSTLTAARKSYNEALQKHMDSLGGLDASVKCTHSAKKM